MPDFEKMYFQLAGRVADITDLLIAAQHEAEETYYRTSKEAEVVPFEVLKTRHKDEKPEED